MPSRMELLKDYELKKNGIEGFFESIKSIWKTMWQGLLDLFTGKTCRSRCSSSFDFSCHIQYICVSWILMFGLILAIFPTLQEPKAAESIRSTEKMSDSTTFGIAKTTITTFVSRTGSALTDRRSRKAVITHTMCFTNIAATRWRSEVITTAISMFTKGGGTSIDMARALSMCRWATSRALMERYRERWGDGSEGLARVSQKTRHKHSYGETHEHHLHPKPHDKDYLYEI